MGNLKKTKKKIIEFNSFSDQETIFREKTGNTFAHFYNRYYTKLVYYILKICNDQQKAEDLSTDAFLQSMSNIHKYDKEKSNFSTWVFTIGRNLALQDIKDNNKNISLDVEYDTEGTTMKDFLKTEEGLTNKQTEINSIKGEIMLEHIKKLKNSYREVIVMRELEHMTYEDIANRLNENINTIKSKIRNGRILLIKSTQKEFEKIDELYSL